MSCCIRTLSYDISIIDRHILVHIYSLQYKAYWCWLKYILHLWSHIVGIVLHHEIKEIGTKALGASPEQCVAFGTPALTVQETRSVDIALGGTMCCHVQPLSLTSHTYKRLWCKRSVFKWNLCILRNNKKQHHFTYKVEFSNHFLAVDIFLHRQLCKCYHFSLGLPFFYCFLLIILRD